MIMTLRKIRIINSIIILLCMSLTFSLGAMDYTLTPETIYSFDFSKLTDGDVVYLDEGQYTAPLELSGVCGDSLRPVLIKPACYEGTDVEKMVIFNVGNNGGEPADHCISITNSHYVTFEGLVLVGAKHAGFHAYADASADTPADSVSGITLENMSVMYNGFTAQYPGNGILIEGDDAIYSDVTLINDIKILNSSVVNNQRDGIVLKGDVENVLVKGNEISRNGTWIHALSHVEPRPSSKAHGIQLLSCAYAEQGYNNQLIDYNNVPAYVTIRDNVFDANVIHGVRTWNAHNILIADNYFHHQGASAIQIEDGTRNFIIENNKSEWNQQYLDHEVSIWVDDSKNGIVRNNTISHETSGVLVWKSKNIVVRNNQVSNMQRKTINYTASILKAGISLVSDSLNDNGLYAALSDFKLNGNTRNVRIAHNTIYQVGSPDNSKKDNCGIYIQESICLDKNVTPHSETHYKNSDIYIKNNIVSTTVSGYEYVMRAVRDRYTEFEGSIDNFVSDYNCFYQPVNSVKMYHWLDEKTELQWKNGGYDTYSLVTDPLFTDAGYGDFSLTGPASGNACIDSGIQLAVITSTNAGDNEITVDDALWFTDGTACIDPENTIRMPIGYTLNNGEEAARGDIIRIGDTDGLEIVDIDYATKTITVDNTFSNTDNTVSFSYAGTAPDRGAVEYRP